MSKMKQARQSKGLTLLQLGNLVGAYPSTISRIERGSMGVSVDLAKRIAAVLEIDPAEIVFMERNQSVA